jgi:hypothetical protein
MRHCEPTFGKAYAFIMVRMHLRSGTDGRKWMVHLDPFHPMLALGPLHLGFAKPVGLHRHFEAFPPDFTVRVAHRQATVG